MSLELRGLLRVEELAVGVEDGESGDAFLRGTLYLSAMSRFWSHLADVYVDEDEVLVEELEVGALVEVDVEYLAVAAPVAAEVEDDTFVLEAGLLEGGGDVGFGVGLCGVEVLLDRWRRGDGRSVQWWRRRRVGLLLQPRMEPEATRPESAMAEENAVRRFDWFFAIMEENLPYDFLVEAACVIGLPAIKEGGDGFGAGVLELFFAFGVEEVAVRVDDGEGGNTFGDGDVVLLRDVDVLVHVADVDVDEDVVFGEDLGVRALVVVDVEDLAVAAPVAAEVEEDALVFAAGADEGGGDVGVGVGGLGVEVLVGLDDDLRGGLGQRRDGQRERAKARAGRSVLRDFEIIGGPYSSSSRRARCNRFAVTSDGH